VLLIGVLAVMKKISAGHGSRMGEAIKEKGGSSTALTCADAAQAPNLAKVAAAKSA
jgi:hypothetical protein